MINVLPTGRPYSIDELTRILTVSIISIWTFYFFFFGKVFDFFVWLFLLNYFTWWWYCIWTSISHYTMYIQILYSLVVFHWTGRFYWNNFNWSIRYRSSSVKEKYFNMLLFSCKLHYDRRIKLKLSSLYSILDKVVGSFYFIFFVTVSYDKIRSIVVLVHPKFLFPLPHLN